MYLFIEAIILKDLKCRKLCQNSVADSIMGGLFDIGPNYISNTISLRTEKTHAVRRNEDAFLLNIPPPPRYNKTNGAF